MHNGKYQCHKAASRTYHYQLSSPSCLTRALQKRKKKKRKKKKKKKPNSYENCLRIFWGEKKKKSQENGLLAEKLQDKTEQED